MKPLWFMFLVLQAFLNVEFSWSQNVITCESGGLDPNMYVSGLTPTGGTIKPGHKLSFLCAPGYQMDGSKEIECLPTGQWNASFPSCSVITCEIGGLDPNLYVSELTPPGGTIKPGHKLRFLCAPGYQMDGSKETECLPTGQWNASFPSCSGIPCKVEPLSVGLRRVGSASQNLVNPGDILRFLCEDEYDMEGSDEVQCLDTGNWNGPFPTCSEKCRIPDIPNTVRITSSVQGNAISKGDTLSFACRQQEHIMQGSPTSRCLGNGEWSDPVPQCSAVVHCSAPPHLDNGDTKSIIRSDAVYRTGEKVEYVCYNKYTMEGNPFKTCDKGVWKGNMRCLKPCTVNEELLSNHGLLFRVGGETKMYAPHLDHLTFVCVRGKKHDGVVPLRPQCNDGLMTLPTCQ